MTKAVIEIRSDDDQDPKAARDITITYVNNDRAFAQSYLNVNAFPTEVYKEVQACTTRFAIFHNQLKLLYHQLNTDKDKFSTYIEDPSMKLNNILIRSNEDRFHAKYDGIEVLSYIHSLFNSLKSFLDVYTLLLCKLIQEKHTMGFKKKSINNESISGGAFINWLKNSAPAEFKNAYELSDYIYSESKEWITAAVNHRDSISHYKDLDDINCLSVTLMKIVQMDEPVFNKNDIADPNMPNNVPVLNYLLDIGERLRKYVRNTIGMFEMVDQSLLNFPEFDVDESTWP